MNAIEFIIERVKEAGSQSAVARKTGVSQGTINKICSGDVQTPTMGTIRKLATAYGKSLSFFLEDWAPDKLNLEDDEEPLSPDEVMLLKLVRESKAARLGMRELIKMDEDQRLQWVLDTQDKMRKGE